jgi:hypothetical protein
MKSCKVPLVQVLASFCGARAAVRSVIVYKIDGSEGVYTD